MKEARRKPPSGGPSQPPLHFHPAAPAPSSPGPLEGRAEFRSALTSWFSTQARDYPWRRTCDPYRILVSELMLQQTRVETVLKNRHYERWLEAFPTLRDLAEASEDRILKAWEGLGYYRRARLLQAAARLVLERHGGEFPRAWAEIRALPGVGGYTAGAVAAFAFDTPAPMVDGNVARVLARLFNYREPVDMPPGRRQLENWSRSLVDPDNARAFQGGLMELGQAICTRRKPACHRCPVARFCQADHPAELPVKRARVEIERVDEWVAWDRKGRRLYLQREEGSRRKGLWRLPLAVPTEEPPLLRLRYAITRYQVTMHVVRTSVSPAAEHPGGGGAWFGDSELDGLAMASPHRRAVEQLLRAEQQGDLLAGDAAPRDRISDGRENPAG